MINLNKQNINGGIRMKKVLSLIIAILVILGCFSVAMAAEETGDYYYMVSQTDNNILFINGTPIEFDPINSEVTPVKNEKGEIFVPVYMTVYCAGGYAHWEQETNSVFMIYNGETISFAIGSDEVKVGEETVKLSAATYAENYRTLVPIDFFETCLKATAEVDEETGTILIAFNTKVYAAG